MYTGSKKISRGKYSHRGYLIVKCGEVWRIYKEGGMSPDFSEPFALKCLAINAIDKKEDLQS